MEWVGKPRKVRRGGEQRKLPKVYYVLRDENRGVLIRAQRGVILPPQFGLE